MVRITRTEEDGAAWLRVEGKLVGPWVEELSATIARERAMCNPIRLDLSQVRFVDSRGLYCLQSLLSEGLQIERMSGFLAGLLHARPSP